MKKALFFAIAIAVTFSACKKKSPTEEIVVEVPLVNPPTDLPFSSLAVEQHKQNLEQSGIEFVQKINTLPNEESINVLSFLADLDPSVSSSSVSSILSIGKAAGKKDIQGVFRATTSASTTESKLSEVYAIYTWNKMTGDWDETASTSKLEFRFPASEVSTTNNAVLTFSYTASPIKATIDGESAELPASATTSLKVNNVEKLNLSSSYAYKADGTPTSVKVNLTLGSFSLNTEVSNTTKNVAAELTLKKGADVLLSLTTAAVGNMSVTDANAIENVSDFIKNANATFQIMNVKLIGVIDVKAIDDANTASSNLSDSLRNEKEALALNTHAKFIAVNKNDNSLIAKVVFVGVSDRDCFSYYNGNTFVPNCYTDFYLDPRLVFKDGSKQSFELFTEQGFSQLIDDLEEFKDSF